MTNKNILDNLNGQEIKEMIDNGKVVLEDLDAAALEKLFDYETDMLCLDEADMGLINACAKRLDGLNGPAMSEEHFWAVINKADAEIVSDKKETAPVDVPVKASSRAVKRRFISKKIWIVAAVIALLVSMAAITSSAFGFNIFEYFKEVIKLSAGEQIEKDAVTLINYGETKEFSSVDKLLLYENLNIMYPSVLPENIVIKQVHVGEGANGGDFIQFIMNDPSTYFSVDTNNNASDVTGYTEQIIINDCTYYLFCDGEFYAVCSYDNCYYYIDSDSYENLVLIIKNMRFNK